MVTKENRWSENYRKDNNPRNIRGNQAEGHRKCSCNTPSYVGNYIILPERTKQWEKTIRGQCGGRDEGNVCEKLGRTVALAKSTELSCVTLTSAE